MSARNRGYFGLLDAGFCEIHAHRDPMNLYGLGRWMSSDRLNLNGLVTCSAPDPIDS